jgi:hypothetical protein
VAGDVSPTRGAAWDVGDAGRGARGAGRGAWGAWEKGRTMVRPYGMDVGGPHGSPDPAVGIMGGPWCAGGWPSEYPISPRTR